jgi:hypothetical protein
VPSKKAFADFIAAFLDLFAQAVDRIGRKKLKLSAYHRGEPHKVKNIRSLGHFVKGK